ncbi:GNAT family N-acetyltransferase [Nocardioides pacificus]
MSWSVDLPDHGRLTVGRLDPHEDARLLHSWVVQERARFWMMRDHTLDEVREVYTWIDEQPTHHAWLVRLDDEPVALLQDYEPRAEPVGETYDVRDGDLGIHLLLAGTSAPRRGFTGAVVTPFLRHALAAPAVRRLVADPDVRNTRAIGRFERLGFTRGPVVDLAVKTAQLLFLDADEERGSGTQGEGA